MSLAQILLKKGILGKEQVLTIEGEAKKEGKREEEIILDKGFVSEEILFNLKSETMNIPLKEVEIEKVPLETLELIPEETARYYQMIPLNRKDDSLEIGMVHPEDFKAQEALKFFLRQGKFNYQIFLIKPSTFNELLKQYKDLKSEVGQALEKIEEEMKEEEKIVIKQQGPLEAERMAEEAPITKIVDVIVKHAVEGDASDIHIEPTKENLRVRFRLLGSLHSSIFLPLDIHPAIVARIKIVSNLKLDESRIPQDGRFSAIVNKKSVDFRVSTLPTVLGEKVAIRVLDPMVGLKTFENLGLGSINFEIVKREVFKPYGLILVTGPTSSGKTTTLYAILHSLNKESTNIVTLEDPVEYFIDGVNQSQIRPEIGYSFATGLRHILRQDPNIIMVGEIRDEETASLTIHAALTGHIVLSTLHTSNATGAIPRLIDLGIKPYLIPPTLRLVIAQRLVKRLCPICKKKEDPKPEIAKIIVKELENLPPDVKKKVKIPDSIKTFQPQGCRECGNSGYTGRTGVFEALAMTDSLTDIILKQPNENVISAEAKRQGMITMQQDGIIKALEGATTIEEVLRVAEEK